MLSFIPRDVLDEILNVIESVSEGFPSYSYQAPPRYGNKASVDGWMTCNFTSFSTVCQSYHRALD